jgi:hypothetical protein
MRVSRYMFSERLNPWMLPIAMMAPHVTPKPAEMGLDNPWRQFEHVVSETISKGLEQYRQIRDAASERTFDTLFGA